MKDENKRSSSQQMNTTHFKNRNVLVNNNKIAGFNGVRPINNPKNNTINNNPDNRILNNDRDLLSKKDDSNINSNNKDFKPKASDINNKINNNSYHIPNRFEPKNRLNNNVNKLRDALDTNPN